jgi:SAM-dependent methyltransferase
MDSLSKQAPTTSFKKPAEQHIGLLLIGGAIAIGVGTLVTFVIYERADGVPTSQPVDEFRIGLNAPYIKTGDAIVDKMVEVAKLSKEDVVYDLGCGDGRLVIAAAVQFGCRGVGIDIDPERVAEAQANAKLHGVEDLVEFREQDVFTVDLSETDVVLMYLLPWMTKRLVPRFQEMKPGSRIVSHDFGIGDIKYIEPERTEEVPIEEENDTHLVHRWTIPLDVPSPRS